MKIEESSPFLQVNAVAKRARLLIMGHPARVRTDIRRPAAVALEELRAGRLEILDPVEAKQILDEDTRAPSEEEQAAADEARAALARMFGDDGDGEPVATDSEAGEAEALAAEGGEPGEAIATEEVAAEEVAAEEVAAEEVEIEEPVASLSPSPTEPEIEPEIEVAAEEAPETGAPENPAPVEPAAEEPVTEEPAAIEVPETEPATEPVAAE